MRDKESIIIKPLLIFIVIATLILSFIHIFVGVDIADEAFYAAEAMLVNQGATPFVNNWTQAPGATMIYSFWVKLYQLFVPDMEGIFLYMRFLFWMYRVGIFALVFYCFKKVIDKWLSIITALPLMIYFYSLIPAFSYTSIPMSFLLIVCVLLIMRREKGTEKSKIPFACGSIMALATLSNPSQIVNCIVLIVLIRVYLHASWKKDILNFIIGGLSVAIIVTGYMVWQAGSIDRLLKSLYIMTAENPYFKLGGSSVGQNLKTIWSWIKYSLKFVVIGVAVSTVLWIILSALKQKGHDLSIRKVIKLGTVIGILYGIIYNIDIAQGLWLDTYVVRILVVGAVICRIVCKECTKLNRAFDIIAIPEIVTLILMGLTVYGGVTYRFYVIFPMGLFCIPYFVHICEELCEEFGIIKLRNSVSTYAGIGLSVLCIIVRVLFSFQYIYGESLKENCFELSYKVEEGIYKGCYTTEQRGKSLIALERYIKDSIDSEDSVLFMEVVPMAYLMSDAKFCTPSTWDIMLYSYGFNDDTLMQEYFEIVSKIPDKIMYIDTGRDEMLSIEKEDYQFNNFVNRNYVCVSEEKISDFRIILYNRQQ